MSAAQVTARLSVDSHSASTVGTHSDPMSALRSASRTRSMSPRRDSAEVVEMEQDARRTLEEQALALQASLLELVERVEAVRAEHERLEGGNRFLQSYIGELMQTSKLTAATGSGVSRSGSRRSAGAKAKGVK